MAICFIFTQYLQEDGCLITRFNDQGEQDLEAKNYSFSEIKALQQGYKTILICSSSFVSIIDLELPWLAERKARAAIPFALEDKLTQPIELLHFVFDKQHYHDGHYEIAVIEKQQVSALMEIFGNQDIEFDSLTLDWYALAPNESIFVDVMAIINSADFKGALSPELAAAFPNIFMNCNNYIFQDSKPNVDLPNKQVLAERSYVWISRRLLDAKPLNLCQGDLQHGSIALQIQKGYRYLASAVGLWLIALLAVNAYKLHVVNNQLAEVDQQIAAIYKQFFPDAKQIINPRFRITQLVGAASIDTQSSFFNLVDKLSAGIKDSNATIDQFRFQNKTLIVTLISPDFATLEKLEDRFKQLQLKVTQTQASSRDQQVFATLELK